MIISIYWKCTRAAKKNICDHLHLALETKVNGETDVDLPQGHPTIAELFQLQERGYIKIRKRHTLMPDEYYQRKRR